MFEIGDIVAIKTETGDIDCKSIGKIDSIISVSDPKKIKTVRIDHLVPYNFNIWSVQLEDSLVKLDVQTLYRLWKYEKSFNHYENIQIRR